MSEPYFGVFIGGSSARSISDLARRSSLDVYVSCSDDGGSTGRINRYCQENNGFTILPPGDIRRVIGALSPYLCEIDPKRSVWEYRFKSDQKGPLSFGELLDLIRKEDEGVEIPEEIEAFRELTIHCDTVQGHPLGNLVLVSSMLDSSGIYGNLEAVRKVASELDCRGRIIPVFPRYATLVYEDETGESYRGEYTLDDIERRDSHLIAKVSIDPPLTYNPNFLDSLSRVDAVIFGPTSQVANIWACLPENARIPENPRGLTEVLKFILNGLRIYSSPIVTERNQTNSRDEILTGLGHLNKLLKKIVNSNKSRIVHAVVRPGPYENDYRAILEGYERELSTPVWWRARDLDSLGILDICQDGLVEVQIIDEKGETKTVLRHNPQAHANAILQAYEQISSE